MSERERWFAESTRETDYYPWVDVYYYICQRLKLEGQTENMGVCTKERKSLGGESGGQKHGGRKDPESGEVAQARGRPARDRGLALPKT